MLESLIYIFKCGLLILGIICLILIAYNVVYKTPKERKQKLKMQKEIMEKVANATIEIMKNESKETPKETKKKSTKSIDK